MSKLSALAMLVTIAFCAYGQDSFDVLAQKAAAAREANDIPGAARFYGAAVALKPDWAEGWWYLGSLAYDADQYAAGQDALTHLVHLQDKAPAWSLLGLCEFETGAYALSLQHIQHALAMGDAVPPEMAPALRFHEAELLVKSGLFDQAMQKYMWFAHRGNPNAAIYPAIGLAALRTPILSKEIPADKQDLYSTAGATAFYWMATDFSQADAGFQTLLSRYPSAPNVHYFYGSYLLPSRPDQAMAEFMRELQLNPASADALAMVALEYLQHDDEYEALTYATKSVDGPSPPPLAHYIYGLLLTRTGRVHQGVEHLEQAEKLDPANLEYHIALAGGYSKLGRSEDSRRERQLTIAMEREGEPAASR
ncbi:MAG: tetratricopeptide repeat protein [Bryobacteraceae bacterium]